MMFALLVLGLGAVPAQTSDAPPAPPRIDGPKVDAPDYDTAGARRLWRPMQGSRDVEVVATGGRRVLKMPCAFRGTDIDRASWDRPFALDMTGCLGLRMEVFCADPSPVSHFSFYFKSGAGWYSGRFAPERRDGWTTVTIAKADTGIEGKPAGWGRIEAIRISAWRGKDVDTEFYIANLRLPGADAPIVVLRGDSVAAHSPGEVSSVKQYAASVARCLGDLELPHAVMSDLDATPERLAGRKLVILPHNPGMPAETAAVLERFLEGGGKMIGFYTFPRRLAGAMGMKPGRFLRSGQDPRFAEIRPVGDALPGMPEVVTQRSWNIHTAEPVEGRSRVAATWFDGNGKDTRLPAIVVSDRAAFMTHVLLDDDWPGKRRMMLAMAGLFLPELWKRAANVSIERIGAFGPYANFEEASRVIGRAAQDKPEASPLLKTASRLRAEAMKRLAAGDPAAAIDRSSEAGDALLKAHCLVQESAPGEHRAFWCHSAFGVSGMDWDEAIETLARNGFTAILPNMLWGGVAYYGSEILPVHASVATRGDQIAACLAACKKYGVACHVWKVNFNTGSAAPKAFLEKMKAAGRAQVRYDGRSDPRRVWLCPSHPDNQKLEIDSMVEVARRYDVDGIHFDYIRYPGPDFCFCDGCRSRFEKAIGRAVDRWPDDCRGRGALKRRWLDFRCDQITAVVRGVHERVRKIKPNVKISAAVFRRQPADADNVGQNWRLWCRKGYLDFVCPMDYTPSTLQFRSYVEHQMEAAGGVPCYPGIGLSVWPDRSDVVKLIDQISVTREFKTGGFTIFNYGVVEARQVVPLCGQGVTRKQAKRR